MYNYYNRISIYHTIYVLIYITVPAINIKKKMKKRKKKSKKRHRLKMLASDGEIEVMPTNVDKAAPWDQRVLDEMKIPLTVIPPSKPTKHFLDMSYLFASSSDSEEKDKNLPENQLSNLQVLSGNIFNAFSSAMGIGAPLPTEDKIKKKTTTKIYEMYD